MKNTTLIIFLLLITVPSLLFSQSRRGEKCDGDRQKIKSEKIAYLTDKLNLSVSEAQSFWPVYNEFSNKMDDLFDEERKLKKSFRNSRNSISDTELSRMMDRIIEIKMERASLEKSYHEQYKKILHADKIILLYDAEFGFRRHLLQKYKDRPCHLEE